MQGTAPVVVNADLEHSKASAVDQPELGLRVAAIACLSLDVHITTARGIALLIVTLANAA
jgi:hypothetical protein